MGSPKGFEFVCVIQDCSRQALHTAHMMAIKTSVIPVQTNRMASSRLCLTTGTSFSTSGSRSKSWCRLRKTAAPTRRNIITALVNATRSAGTPACSIADINIRIFAFIGNRLRTFFVGCFGASVGFFVTAEEGIGSPSSEVNARVLALVPFGSEDRFRVGARNFADCNPADAANQRAEQKRNRGERNEGEETQSNRKRAV